jgi:phospholipid/cholesterol/gamma-HCH transport system permease protein
MEFKFFEHFGRFVLMLKGMFTRPENVRMYWKEFMKQCVDIGVGSLGIVFIIATFLGAVTTVQTAYQLVSDLIPKSTIAQIVRDTLILELAPTMVCIVLGGVVGSKIASELGNMRVSEQIDAQEIMGINTKAYLIAPKILAALVTIPCLVIIAAFLGVWGGLMAGKMSGILSEEIYMQGLRDAFDGYNVFVMLCKAYTYSFIISSIPGVHQVGGGELHPHFIYRLSYSGHVIIIHHIQACYYD